MCIDYIVDVNSAFDAMSYCGGHRLETGWQLAVAQEVIDGAALCGRELDDQRDSREHLAPGARIGRCQEAEEHVLQVLEILRLGQLTGAPRAPLQLRHPLAQLAPLRVVRRAQRREIALQSAHLRIQLLLLAPQPTDFKKKQKMQSRKSYHIRTNAKNTHTIAIYIMYSTCTLLEETNEHTC